MPRPGASWEDPFVGYRGGTARVVAIVGAGHRGAAAALGIARHATAHTTENKTIIAVIASGSELAQFDKCGEVKEAVRRAGLSVELKLVSGDTTAMAIDDAYHLGLSPSGSGICIPNGAVLQLESEKSVPADHVIWAQDTEPQCSHPPQRPADGANVGVECTLDPAFPACGAWLWSMHDAGAAPTTPGGKEARLRELGSEVAQAVLHDLRTPPAQVSASASKTAPNKSTLKLTPRL